MCVCARVCVCMCMCTCVCVCVCVSDRRFRAFSKMCIEDRLGPLDIPIYCIYTVYRQICNHSEYI